MARYSRVRVRAHLASSRRGLCLPERAEQELVVPPWPRGARRCDGAAGDGCGKDQASADDGVQAEMGSELETEGNDGQCTFAPLVRTCPSPYAHAHDHAAMRRVIECKSKGSCTCHSWSAASSIPLQTSGSLRVERARHVRWSGHQTPTFPSHRKVDIHQFFIEIRLQCLLESFSQRPLSAAGVVAGALPSFAFQLTGS